VGVIPMIGGLGHLHILVCIMQQVKEIVIGNDIEARTIVEKTTLN
jgi:hypothetical protein